MENDEEINEPSSYSPFVKWFVLLLVAGSIVAIMFGPERLVSLLVLGASITTVFGRKKPSREKL